MLRNRVYLIALAAAFLVFFRGQTALHLAGTVDDACYARSLYWFLSLPLPQCYADFYPGGLALIWLPAGLLGLLLGKISGMDPRLWIEPLIALTSFCLYAGSLFLMDGIFRKAKNPPSSWWMLGFFFAIPALHYATARTFLAHSAELFLSSVLLALVVSRRYLPAVLCLAWLVATRIGDAPLALLVAGPLFADPNVTARAKAFVCAIVVMVLIPVAYFALFSGYGTSAGQEGSFLLPILSTISIGEVGRTLAGDHNGMIWSAPWWLFTLFLGLRFWKHLDVISRSGLGVMCFLLLICFGWTGNGGGLFYRYLIGTYPVAGWIALQTAPMLSVLLRRTGYVLLAWQAIYVTVVTWLFGTRFGHSLFQGSTPPIGDVLKNLFLSVTLLAVSVPGLVLFSWSNPSDAEWWGVRLPTYRLNGPALWLLTAACLALFALIIRLCYNRAHGRANHPH